MPPSASVPPAASSAAAAPPAPPASSPRSRRRAQRNRSFQDADAPREKRNFPVRRSPPPLVESMMAERERAERAAQQQQGTHRGRMANRPVSPYGRSTSGGGGRSSSPRKRAHGRSHSAGETNGGRGGAGGGGNGSPSGSPGHSSGGETPLLLGMIVDKSSFDSGDVAVSLNRGRSAPTAPQSSLGPGSMFWNVRRGRSSASGVPDGFAHLSSESERSDGGELDVIDAIGVGAVSQRRPVTPVSRTSEVDADDDLTADTGGSVGGGGGGSDSDSDIKLASGAAAALPPPAKRKTRRYMRWKLSAPGSKKKGQKDSSVPPPPPPPPDCSGSVLTADNSTSNKSFHTMGSAKTAKHSNTRRDAKKKRLMELYKSEMMAKQKSEEFKNKKASPSGFLRHRIRGRPPKAPDLSSDDDGDVSGGNGDRSSPAQRRRLTDAQARRRRKQRLKKAVMSALAEEDTDGDYTDGEGGDTTDGEYTDGEGGDVDTDGSYVRGESDHRSNRSPSPLAPHSPSPASVDGSSIGHSFHGLSPHNRMRAASVQVKRERVTAEDTAGLFAGNALGGKRGRSTPAPAPDDLEILDDLVRNNNRGVRFDSLASWEGENQGEAMITPPLATHKKKAGGVGQSGQQALTSRSASSASSRASSKAGTVSTASLSDVSRSLSPEFGSSQHFDPYESPAGSRLGSRKQVPPPVRSRTMPQSTPSPESPWKTRWTPPSQPGKTPDGDARRPPPPPPPPPPLSGPPSPLSRADGYGSDGITPEKRRSGYVSDSSVGGGSLRSDRPPLPPSRLGSMAASSGLLSDPTEYLASTRQRRSSNGSRGSSTGSTKVYKGSADDVLRLDNDDADLNSLGSLDTDEDTWHDGSTLTGGSTPTKGSLDTSTRRELQRLQAMSEGISSGGPPQVSRSPTSPTSFSTVRSPSSLSSSVEARRRTQSTAAATRGRHRGGGPVDLDDADTALQAALQAELNLRAIHDLGARHLEHGEYDDAVEVFHEIYRGQRERYGPDHPRVGTALHNVGIVLLRAGRYTLAVDVCRSAVEARSNALGKDHPDVAVSLAQLGIAHLECGQHKRALVAFREALRIRRMKLGPKHPKVAKVLNNVGCSLFELGELDGAMLAFEETLEIQRSVVAGTNPSVSPASSQEEDDNGKGGGGGSRGSGGSGGSSGSNADQQLLSIAATQCNIGSILLRLGRHEEAVVALEEALLIQQSVLGDEHPTVLATLESIDYVDKAKEGGYEDAFKKMKESARSALEKFGFDKDRLEAAASDVGCTSLPPALASIVTGATEKGCSGAQSFGGKGRSRSGTVRPIREEAQWGVPSGTVGRVVDTFPRVSSKLKEGCGHSTEEDSESSVEHDLVSL